MRQLVNGTALAWRGQGVLIRGPSGSGKSDLTLRLLDSGATLISDDVVEMKRADRRLLLSFPPESPSDLKGKIVARGLGLVDVAAAPPEVELALVVEATPPAEVEILPESLDSEWLGLPVTTLRIPLLEPSAPAKVRLALAKLSRSIIPPS
jgi:HPr kinase/phosphorylase